MDAVAGGTIEQLQKDLKFFKALGFVKNQNLNPDFKNPKNVKAMQTLWGKAGFNQRNVDSYVNKDTYYVTIMDGKPMQLGRQDAMIYTMRKYNKYLNLEDFT